MFVAFDLDHIVNHCEYTVNYCDQFYRVIRDKEFVRLCSGPPGNQQVVECWNAALAGSRHQLVQGGSCNLSRAANASRAERLWLSRGRG